MELLLISGLLGEAAWFANRLGDWKIAFLLSVTEVFRKTNLSYVEKESHGQSILPIEAPQPEQLMKERIKMILKLDGSITVGCPFNPVETRWRVNELGATHLVGCQLIYDIAHGYNKPMNKPIRLGILLFCINVCELVE